MQVSFSKRKIATTQSLKFLRHTINTSLTLKYHISELTSSLNKDCYAIRLIKPFMSLDVLKSTYFLTFTQLYLMESYSGRIQFILKKCNKYGYKII